VNVIDDRKETGAGTPEHLHMLQLAGVLIACASNDHFSHTGVVEPSSDVVPCLGAPVVRATSSPSGFWSIGPLFTPSSSPAGSV
jgi:hypothetical protein